MITVRTACASMVFVRGLIVGRYGLKYVWINKESIAGSHFKKNVANTMTTSVSVAGVLGAVSSRAA